VPNSSQQFDPKQYRGMLLNREKAILLEDEAGVSGVATVTLDQSSVGRVSRVDALQAQAMSVAAHERRMIELKRIAAALQRIEEGEYGYCQNCGEFISPERLEIDLSAEYCIKCASELEKRGQ